ncbi:hypothetical protein K8R32_01755 [bacterium]|nr:hypothetical protein [bacterium]
MYLRNGDLHFLTSARGASGITLKKGGRDYFYPPEIVKINGVDKWRGKMHPCSPIFGSPEGKGIFSLAPPHGELRDELWFTGEIDWIKEEEPGGATGCEYYLDYTHWETSIRYHVFYRLINNCLEVTTKMTNHNSSPVPIELGWHPYFNAPQGGTIRFVNTDFPNINIQGAYGPKIFPAGLVVIELNGIGTVEMMPYEGFKTGKICVWTDWERKYFCVEPLLSYHQFDTEKGIYLYPEETFIAKFVMCFKD